MENIYIPEKLVWTEVDLNLMSWHDNTIHSFSFQDDYKLALDIDYIFEWVKKPKSKHYKFWIAPCTIIFENVYDIIFDLEISTSSNPIIDHIEFSNPRKPKNADYIEKQIEYDWTIEMISGNISFKSVGFKQYVRKPAILTMKQKLLLNERGRSNFDISFEGEI